MKKKGLRFLLASCLSVLLFSACTGEEVLQEAVFEMDENATTGYVWDVSQEGSGVFEVQREVVEDSASTSEMLVGAGQMIRYTLVPQEAGEVNVTFLLSRPWEGGEKAYEASFVFELSEDGSCTLISEEEHVTEGEARPAFKGPIL